MNARLILASTSPYRRTLLARLGLEFEALKPALDEEKEKRPEWTPIETATKLAEMKARSVAKAGTVVIGGDQLVNLDGRILGKPGTRDKAIAQLESMSGRAHELITAVCVIGADGRAHALTDITKITMKKLTRAQIENLVDLDEPFDCAGSYKIEKHGIALVEKLESADFTAIEGLPLIELSKTLAAEGVPVLAKKKG